MSCDIPPGIRRPWQVFEDLMQRLVKDAKYDSLYPAARAQLSSWRGKGAMQAFLDLEEVEQRMFIDVSLAELAAYVLWRTSIRVRPFRVKRCKPDSARSELLQRRRTPELRLQDEWGQLASEEKANWAVEDPRAVLAGEDRWAPLLASGAVSFGESNHRQSENRGACEQRSEKGKDHGEAVVAAQSTVSAVDDFLCQSPPLLKAQPRDSKGRWLSPKLRENKDVATKVSEHKNTPPTQSAVEADADNGVAVLVGEDISTTPEASQHLLNGLNQLDSSAVKRARRGNMKGHSHLSSKLVALKGLLSEAKEQQQNLEARLRTRA